MSRNPEDSVIDAIAALVDEQLAIGPVDDYSADRYVKCPHCGCDWHGIMCASCGCNWDCRNGDGEVSMTERLHRTTNPAYRRDIDFNLIIDEGLDAQWRRNEAAWAEVGTFSEGEGPDFVDPVFWRDPPWMIHSERRDDFNSAIDDHVCQPDATGRHCVWADCATIFPPRGGYTISDLVRMRRRSWVRSDYPQRYVLGEGQWPQVRFWVRDPRLRMIEGAAEVMNIDWEPLRTSVRIRLDPCRELVWNDEQLADDLRPATSMVPGMVSMEGATPEGFVPIGFLNPDDLNIERYTEPEVLHWGGDVMRAARERFEATIRFTEP